MLISSSTDIYSGLGQVSSTMFNDFQTPFILIVGVIFAFFVITLLLRSFYPDKYPNEIEYIEK